MNPQPFVFLLARSTALIICLLSSTLPAVANSRIRGEFEYDIDARELSEWQIGPVFSFGEDEEIELDIPIGQDDNVWIVEPELTYEVNVDDLSIEFGIGFEAFFDEEEAFQPFGGIEASVDF